MDRIKATFGLTAVLLAGAGAGYAAAPVISAGRVTGAATGAVNFTGSALVAGMLVDTLRQGKRRRLRDAATSKFVHDLRVSVQLNADDTSPSFIAGGRSYVIELKGTILQRGDAVQVAQRENAQVTELYWQKTPWLPFERFGDALFGHNPAHVPSDYLSNASSIASAKDGSRVVGVVGEIDGTSFVALYGPLGESLFQMHEGGLTECTISEIISRDLPSDTETTFPSGPESLELGFTPLAPTA